MCSEITAPASLLTLPPAVRPTAVDASMIWPELCTVVELVAPATPTPDALITPVLRLVTVPPRPRRMASLKPLLLVIVPALSTVEGPPRVEPPLALIERPVKPPVIVPPNKLTTVEPPPSSAPLKPAVIDPEFVRVNDRVSGDCVAGRRDRSLVGQRPAGLAGAATPVPSDVTVAALKTVALVTPGPLAQPADPSADGADRRRLCSRWRRRPPAPGC